MTDIAIGLGIALLVAGVVATQRGNLLAGCAAVLGLGTCFNYHLASFEVGPLTVTLDRLAVLGVAGAWALRVALGHTVPRRPDGRDLVLVALCGLLVLSTFSGDWRGSPEYPPPFWRLIAGYLMPATLYWIARDSSPDERSFGRLLGVLTLFGFYLALTGMLEVAGQWSFVFPPHIADPSRGNHFGRARGPMLQSLSMGLYLGVGLLAAWLWLLRRPGTVRLAVAAGLPVLLVGLALSYTRTVYVAVAAGAVVVTTLTLRRPWQKAAAVAVIVGLLALPFARYGFLRFHRGLEAEGSATTLAASEWRPHPRESPENTKFSVVQRAMFVYVSWKMFLDRPWLGVGFGHFPEAKAPYLDDPSTSLDLRSIGRLTHHNHFLSLLTETGLLGLALFLALLAVWLGTAWRLWRDPRRPGWARAHGALVLGTLGIYGSAWMFWDLSFAPIDHGLLFLLAGIAVALERSAATSPRERAGAAKLAA